MAEKIAPVTQVEKRIAAMAGADVEGIREPVTRVEKLLAQLAESIGDTSDEGTTFTFRKVDRLPDTGETGVFYLVSAGGLSLDVYDEYVWIEDDSTFEKLGSTRIDLSDYVPVTRTINGKALTADIVLDDSDVFSNSDITDSSLEASIAAAYDEVFG